MKKIQFILLSALVLLSVSCDKYLDVNNNVDTPDWVEPYLRLSPIEAKIDGVQLDLRGINQLAGYWGSGSYATYAKHGYVGGNDYMAQQWKLVYFDFGINLELLIKDAIAEEMYSLAGMGYILKAYAWDLGTKQVGDMPLDQAFDQSVLGAYYNTQEDIYKAVRQWAHQGIAYLNMDNGLFKDKIGKADLIYKGDVEKWKMFGYAVLARNFLSLANKKDFVSSGMADSVIIYTDRSFKSDADNAELTYEASAQADTNNSFGIVWGNNTGNYSQSDYLRDVLTGRVAVYDMSNKGAKTDELQDPQIICDTLVEQPGHFDPRAAVLLSAGPLKAPMRNYALEGDKDSVRYYTYPGSQLGAGSISGSGIFNQNAGTTATKTNSGIGRWLYRDNANFPIATYAELQFGKAEALWKKGDVGQAFQVWKGAVAAHMTFVEKFIYVNAKGGDRIDKATFRKYADLYLNGPYVNGLPQGKFTLSHIMMQRWIALYPWSPEAWVDLRRYHYDLKLGASGLPEPGISYDAKPLKAYMYQKEETDPTRVYKGFYVPAADVDYRRRSPVEQNMGAPAYRFRPRYNSEYKWNTDQLDKIKPISGMADNYHTSVMWFAIP